jgi:chorismate mutase
MDLSLDIIAARLEGLEETIISKLIDRAQFAGNEAIYQTGKSGFITEPHRSLFEVRLWYQEEMDAKFGRFQVPEEHPFSTGLPAPMRIVHLQDDFLKVKNCSSISLTQEIRDSYLQLIPHLCKQGDDGQYGSSTEHDVFALQAISRRIHFGGLYVGESKYRQEPEVFKDLVKKNDTETLWIKLTRKNVEDAIIERVREKVAYLQGRINAQVRHKIDPEIVLKYYRDTIIPLTKKGEILYIQKRALAES